jgi:SAM-dependent MidA family methyltransferase
MLLEEIIGRIRRSPDGTIPFDEYMDLCLYFPRFGYYAGDIVRTGKDGDFYTSAHIGGFMGKMLARYIARRSAASCSGSDRFLLAEWGGGAGEMAVQVLDELRNTFPDVYERLDFLSVETSPAHRRRQERRLSGHAGKTAWIDGDEWERAAARYDRAVVWSNELLDAFPVKRAVYESGGWREIRVGWNERNERLEERRLPLRDAALAAYLEQKPVEWQEGQQVEVNFRAMEWIRRMAASLPAAATLITIDYGDEDAELFAPHRLFGTLRGYRRHTVTDDPFATPGEQDLTAHVNFSDLIACGREAGFDGHRLVTQQQFLVEAGILEELREHRSADPFHPDARANRMIRQLLLSDHMSELFKVLIQWKGGQ